MNYDMKESGKRIQQLRSQYDYTQEEFASVINIDRSNLSRIESGKRGCSLELLVQISTLFDVSLDYLVLGQDRSDAVALANKEKLKENLAQLIVQMERFRASL